MFPLSSPRPHEPGDPAATQKAVGPGFAALPGEADERTRTADPFITSEALYQLSYVGEGAPWSDLDEPTPAPTDGSDGCDQAAGTNRAQPSAGSTPAAV